jgi:hypothetical protein
MGFITDEGLLELDNNHYKGAGYTPLDKLMNPFWEWCDTLIPKVELQKNVVIYSQSLQIPSPLWVSFLWVLHTSSCSITIKPSLQLCQPGFILLFQSANFYIKLLMLLTENMLETQNPHLLWDSFSIMVVEKF